MAATVFDDFELEVWEIAGSASTTMPSKLNLYGESGSAGSVRFVEECGGLREATSDVESRRWRFRARGDTGDV
jgi:hypothetical protein